MNNRSALCLLAGALLILGGAALRAGDETSGQEGTPPAPEETAQEPAHGMPATKKAGPPGEGKGVLLLFSVNNVGFIDVCGCPKKKLRQGSVTRRSSFLKQLRGRGRPLLVADSGNTLFDYDDLKAQDFQKTQLIEKAKVIIESYNRMEYRVLAVGHLDLAMGLDQLFEYQKMAKFPFICANLAWKEPAPDSPNGGLVFPPTHEVEVNGVKVGFVGLISNTVQDYYLEKRASKCKLLDGIAAATKYVPALRERNDVVVLLSCNEAKFNEKLLQAVPGIDIAIDPYFDEFGNLQRQIEPAEYCFRVGDTVLARTRPEGHSLGTIELNVLTGGRPLFDRSTGETAPKGRSTYLYKREPIEPHMLGDPEIDLLVEAFKKGTSFTNTALLPPLPNKEKYLTAETCKACHTPQYDWWKGTQHSNAFAGLTATNDQWRQDCIGCHTLGYGAAFLDPAESEPFHNVQCESCHGLNPEHPADPVKHAWPKIKEENCLVCHNESQTREKFQYPSMKKKVACPKK